MNRLVEYHIKRLQDKSAAVRLKSIEELRLLGDPAALPALKTVYETDTEPEVRKAAQNAGREIFIKTQKKGGDS
jgi:HEAT repeat protein